MVSEIHIQPVAKELPGLLENAGEVCSVGKKTSKRTMKRTDVNVLDSTD